MENKYILVKYEHEEHTIYHVYRVTGTTIKHDEPLCQLEVTNTDNFLSGDRTITDANETRQKATDLRKNGKNCVCGDCMGALFGDNEY